MKVSGVSLSLSFDTVSYVLFHYAQRLSTQTILPSGTIQKRILDHRIYRSSDVDGLGRIFSESMQAMVFSCGLPVGMYLLDRCTKVREMLQHECICTGRLRRASQCWLKAYSAFLLRQLLSCCSPVLIVCIGSPGDVYGLGLLVLVKFHQGAMLLCKYLFLPAA